MAKKKSETPETEAEPLDEVQSDGDESVEDTADEHPEEEVMAETVSEEASEADTSPDEVPDEEEPAREDEASHEAEELAHEEEAHGSFASKVLTGLILLLVGGGIALWGAPKIAPNLPSGIGPVKAWLMPGQSAAEAEIAALRTEFQTALANMPDPVDQATIDTAIADALNTARGEIDVQIREISDQMAGTDGAEIEGRLSAAETRLRGLTAELNELKSAMMGLSGGVLDEESLAEVAGFSAAIEGLKAEISDLAARDGALSQRLEEVTAATEQQVERARTTARNAQDTALVRSGLANIDAALSNGAPFVEAVDTLGSVDGVEVPAALADVAESGVASLPNLRSSFGDAAHSAIQAAITAEAGNEIGGRLSAFVKAQVASRSLTPIEGDSTDAVLSRAEAALKADDLAGSLSELESLEPDVAAAMGDWIDRAQKRMNAERALKNLTGTLLAEN